jgi:hypothetical protein
MKVQGSCLCGRITYEAKIDPEKVTLCTCPDSQKLTGCGNRLSVPAPSESFKLLTGKPRAYSKAAKSCAIWLCSFCSDCGAPVYSCAVYQPSMYWLSVSCLGERSDLPPKKTIRCRSPCVWPIELARASLTT